MIRRRAAPALFALALGGALALPAAARDSHPGEPAGDPSAWVTTGDYPAQALKASQQGTTGFRVDYDANGVPTACTITVSSGVASLDETTCKIVVLRARFTPGTDRKGRTVGGSYTNRVRWVIPRTDLAHPLAMTRTISFVLGVDGTPLDCRVEDATGAAAGKERTPCTEEVTFKPYTDAAGKPVTKRVRMTQTVIVEDVD